MASADEVPMDDQPIDDPLLDLAVERALDPLRALLPPTQLEELRKTTHFALSTHPQAQELLRRLRARLALDRSNTQAKGGPVAAFLEKEAAKRGGRLQ